MLRFHVLKNIINCILKILGIFMSLDRQHLFTFVQRPLYTVLIQSRKYSFPPPGKTPPVKQSSLTLICGHVNPGPFTLIIVYDTDADREL
jgi:hypothetical protein